MKRRDFIKSGAASVAFLSSLTCMQENGKSHAMEKTAYFRSKSNEEIEADVVIVGGSLGGCAAALGALRNGLRVVMTEETDWIGGQLTSQGVPPDEHPWIESHGATKQYREFRNAIRQYYIRNYPLKDEARKRTNLNPGDGAVSRLCHEPRVALSVLYDLFNPYISSGKLAILLEHKPHSAEITGDRIDAVNVIQTRTGFKYVLRAPYFIDATELGDLLPLTGTEFRNGTEVRSETNEFHAPEKGNPDNQQAFTVIFAMDYDKDGNHLIEKPAEYDFWRDYVPQMTPAWCGKLLGLTYCMPATLKPLTLGFHPEGIQTGNVMNLWNYRRIINKNNFLPGVYRGDVTISNWPQNDYLLGNLDGSEKDFQHHLARAKQLSLSLFYWLQTEVPRPDGGQGWPGLRLRGDILGTEDGMAKYPYVRESRRIKAVFTVLEEHVGKAQREKVTGKTETLGADFFDSVGVGYYRIDLHPSTAGDNYIDFESLRYQIPLGSLLPQRMTNLLPACKNIGTTHITNGCYRVHPAEWNIGESVGMLATFAIQKKQTPHAVRENSPLLEEFQDFIRSQGIETHWPN